MTARKPSAAARHAIAEAGRMCERALARAARATAKGKPVEAKDWRASAETWSYVAFRTVQP